MAATEGIRNGSGMTVYFSGTDGSEVIVDHITDFTYTVNVDMVDISTKNNGGYQASLPRQKNASLSLTAFYAADATNGYTDLVTAWLAGTKQYVKVTSVDYDAAGDATEHVDDYKYEFAAYIESVELSAGTEDNATYTVNFRSEGAITQTVIGS